MIVPEYGVGIIRTSFGFRCTPIQSDIEPTLRYYLSDINDDKIGIPINETSCDWKNLTPNNKYKITIMVHNPNGNTPAGVFFFSGY